MLTNTDFLEHVGPLLMSIHGLIPSLSSVWAMFKETLFSLMSECLKGLVDVCYLWVYILSTRRVSMMSSTMGQWNRAQWHREYINWGWSHFYSPETEWPFSLFLVMWYPMHPLHIQNANSLCLLIDMSHCKGPSMCIRAHTLPNAYVYAPHSNGYALFTWWSTPLENALSVIGWRMNKLLGSQSCLKDPGKNKKK